MKITISGYRHEHPNGYIHRKWFHQITPEHTPNIGDFINTKGMLYYIKNTEGTGIKVMHDMTGTIFKITSRTFVIDPTDETWILQLSGDRV